MVLLRVDESIRTIRIKINDNFTVLFCNVMLIYFKESFFWNFFLYKSNINVTEYNLKSIRFRERIDEVYLNLFSAISSLSNQESFLRLDIQLTFLRRCKDELGYVPVKTHNCQLSIVRRFQKIDYTTNSL